MKAKIIIFIILNIFGFLLATLGNISYSLFWGAAFFWPAVVIGSVGPILFGWTGVLAEATFPIFSNIVIGQSYTTILLLTPTNFLQGYLMFFLFKKFNCDFNLRGIKAILFFLFIVATTAQLCGGILYSFILLCLGKVTNINDVLKILFAWIVTIPWILIFGVPIIKIFAPILKEYGFLFGQTDVYKNPFTINHNIIKWEKGRSVFTGLPIFLKIFLSLLAVGVIPISILGTYEIIMSNPDIATLNVSAIFTCFGFFATLMLTGVLTTAIITPIKKLFHGVEKIRGGDFDYKIDTVSEDELGKLAEAFNDMSETVKGNIQQKEAYLQKIAEQEKLVAVGNSVSLIAHDVRKPFATLKMMLEMFPKLTPGQVQKHFEDLDITIRKVDAMLLDVMEVSREKEYDLTPENILSVLDLAIKDISRCYPDKHVDFYYQLNIVPLINLDEQRMCRAFDNIIANAFDFLPEEKGIMWFSVKRVKEQAEIVIGNSHSRIPEEKINDIFRSNFTMGKKGGTGLGLSIVHKIITGHNGSVFARNVDKSPDFVPAQNTSSEGGVEFVISLPLTEIAGYALKDPLLKNSEEAKAMFGMVQKENQLAGSSQIDALIKKLKALPEKPSLLILDDETIYRARVRSIMGNMEEVNKFILAYEASSHKEAVDLLNRVKIDYLICDIDLSDSINTGFSVLSYAISKYPNCRVLMHTNRKDPSDIDEAKKLGACGFCPKPITEAIMADFLIDKTLWPDETEKKQEDKEILEYAKVIPDSKILLVDDDEMNLNHKRDIFEIFISPEDNIHIYGAITYEEAINIIDDINPDILLTDFNLESVKTGLEICQYIKKKSPASTCAIISGMFRSHLIKLKNENEGIVDEVFSMSKDNPWEILNTVFEIRKQYLSNYSENGC